MIGIVILGLGLIMVASLFPVGWTRARKLAEFTVQRSVTGGMATNIRPLVSVSGPDANRTSFLGDLLFNEVNGNILPHDPVLPASGFWTDTLVHALTIENIGMRPRGLEIVSEDLWRRQDPQGVLTMALNNLEGKAVAEQSYFRPQMAFHERVYPPLPPLPPEDEEEDRDKWFDELDSRRFAVSVLHRLRQPVSYDPQNPGAAPDAARTFDVYYVTLRRTNPTQRFAQQEPDAAPNPYNLAAPLRAPQAQGSENDLMFPVPWRIQVEFPSAQELADAAPGIPTEIVVPPRDAPGSGALKAMIVGMFQPGTSFLDEITGTVYRVEKRRVGAAGGEEAVLTLDRQVVPQNLLIPEDMPLCQGSCAPPGQPYYQLVRTVWVFPPPVLAERGPNDTLIFDGGSPVVGIDVRSMIVTP